MTARGDTTKGKRWLLGLTERELVFAEFQHALICLSEAFYRYKGNYLAHLSGESTLNGQDSVILHAIQTMERPKSITEIQHFTNRSDVANIQYSVRKLVRVGLIRKAPKDGRSTAYSVTAKGQAVIQEYIAARRELLDEFPDNVGRLKERINEARKLMVMMTGLYDQASRQLTTRSKPAKP